MSTEYSVSEVRCPLRVSVIQGETRWHDPEANRAYYGELVGALHNITDLVVLPETFTSGFSNEAIDRAETMDGPTVEWMRGHARDLDAAVMGSVQLRTDAGVTNRLLFVTPDGEIRYYDKRHLFRYAGEHERYTAGRERQVIEWRGWRICPLVCYDLRFPVFSRNRYDVERPGDLDYDLLVYVANWPSARANVWRTLLRARAMENLSYVVGVNRVGTDGNGLSYDGESAVIDYQGNAVSECTDMEVVSTTTLFLEEQNAFRKRFPAMLDADRFELLEG